MCNQYFFSEANLQMTQSPKEIKAPEADAEGVTKHEETGEEVAITGEDGENNPAGKEKISGLETEKILEQLQNPIIILDS